MPYNSLCDFVQIVGSPSGIKVMTVRYFTGWFANRRKHPVWRLRSSLNNSGVIPAKLAIASASRNPGISKDFWIPAFAGMTDEDLNDLFNELWFQDTSDLSDCITLASDLEVSSPANSCCWTPLVYPGSGGS